MKKQKAIISFLHVRDNDLTEIAQLVHDKMFSNPDFPNPIPTLADFFTAIQFYSDALIKSKDGTKKDTAFKNAKRKILVKMLSNLGNYVNITADGDLSKLDGSGFPLTKVPEPVGILKPPKFIEVSEGKNPCSVNFKIALVRRASGYIVLFYTPKEDGSIPANDSEWQSKTFSKSKGQITNLKSGKKYVFKAAATSHEANKISLYNFTEPIEKFVQ